jgi:hypothetical protein
MNWHETLPDKCPPHDALLPDNEKYFRLVSNIPPNEDDFSSHRKIWPYKKFNTSECRARSLSIQKDLEFTKSLLRLPANVSKYIVSVILKQDSGVILKTGQSLSHYSWWRSTHFAISSAKKVLS